jgi:hypothetical protein
MIARPVHHILRVYTDGFQVYSLFDERENYFHFTIVHAHNFGEGLRTTNSIESFWGKLKALAQFNTGFHPTSIEEVQYIYFYMCFYFLGSSSCE